MPATATGRGAQVVIDPGSDTEKAIRGAYGPTFEANAAKAAADIAAGLLSDGNRPDGTTPTTVATDFAVVPGPGIRGSATFAALPAAAGASGQIFSVTDVGIGPSLWASDGTRWKPLYAVTLGRSAVAGNNLTGTTNETAMATINVPANAMGIDGGIWLKMMFTMTGSTNGKTVRVRLKELGIGSLMHSALINTATNITYAASTSWRNRGVTNAQVGIVAGQGDGTAVQSTQALCVAALDTTVLQPIIISGQLAVGTETITLERYEVLLVP